MHQGRYRRVRLGEDRVRGQRDQLGARTTGALWISICIAIVKLNVATFGPTEFLEALLKSNDKCLCLCVFSKRAEHADATNPIARLLCARRGLS